jgi:hypothetical protein
VGSVSKIISALDAITAAVFSYKPVNKGQASATIERRLKDAEAAEKKDNQSDR